MYLIAEEGLEENGDSSCGVGSRELWIVGEDRRDRNASNEVYSNVLQLGKGFELARTYLRVLAIL